MKGDRWEVSGVYLIVLEVITGDETFRSTDITVRKIKGVARRKAKERRERIENRKETRREAYPRVLTAIFQPPSSFPDGRIVKTSFERKEKNSPAAGFV